MEENENKIDIIKVVDRFYKNIVRMKKMILVVVVVFTLLSFVRSFLSFEKSYSSKAVFIASSTKGGSMYVTSTDNDEILSMFNSLITSSSMKEVIMEQLNMDHVPGSISVKRIPETNLIELKVTSSDPDDAYAVITCILNNYSQVTKNVMSDISMNVLDTPMLAQSTDQSPHHFKNALKGTIMGAFLSLAFVFILSVIRHTICFSSDVKDKLNLVNLANIPYRQNVNHDSLLLTNPRIQYGYRHAFHDLRMKIEQDHRKNNNQVYMITSTLPNEGKSTVSFNTAIALAQKQVRVALVDMDLRNPSLIEMVNVERSILGIGDYLNECATIKEVLYPFMENLDVIFGTESFGHAPELLSTEEFLKLIKYLKKNYEYVILDVPPLYMMEDALLVSKYCDSSLVVIKQDFANVYDISESLEELNANVKMISGTIINQVMPSLLDKETSSYGYGYGYGYGREKS